MQANSKEICEEISFTPFFFFFWYQHFCLNVRLIISKKCVGPLFSLVDSNSPRKDLLFPHGPKLVQKPFHFVSTVLKWLFDRRSAIFSHMSLINITHEQYTIRSIIHLGRGVLESGIPLIFGLNLTYPFSYSTDSFIWSKYSISYSCIPLIILSKYPVPYLQITWRALGQNKKEKT